MWTIKLGADYSSGAAAAFGPLHAREVKAVTATLYNTGANQLPALLAVSLASGGAIVASGSCAKQTNGTYTGALDLDQSGIVSAIGAAQTAEFWLEIWSADDKVMIGRGIVDVARNDSATGTPTPTPTDGWKIVEYEGKRMLAWTFPDGNKRVLVPRIVDGIEAHSWIEV